MFSVDFETDAYIRLQDWIINFRSPICGADESRQEGVYTMGVKTRDEYLVALQGLRPNIHKFGELIEDVTTHPATKRTVESHALNYDAANDPELEEIYTTTSVFSGDRILRWNSMM
jgi:hypothetical protein